MNRGLDRLQPYPFEKLRDLLRGVTPPALPAIRLSIGEPQHATPALIRQAMADHLDGLSVYPTTAGMDTLRETIAAWLCRRYGLPALDPATQVLPVNGTREALFAFAQCVIDSTEVDRTLVVCPNPFYQIYEGAAILAGANNVFYNQTPSNGFTLDFGTVTRSDRQYVTLIYVCSPGNPTGHVMTLDEWAAVFELADQCGAMIASDECYSEIYPVAARPPLGGLEAAHRLGRRDFRRLVVFGSLSKRSNVPGLRSGYAAGDAWLIEKFLRYRTYHGCAMSLAAQHASVAAWNDEAHVQDNREHYQRKFDAVVPLLSGVLDVQRPDAGFYLWAGVPGGDDEAFVRQLHEATHVTVLPGTYLSRDSEIAGDDAPEEVFFNPGRGFVRIALVPEFEVCVEAARRIAEFCR